MTHLRQAGFAVRVTELPRIEAVQWTAGVPPELASCSIALHDAFSFSGHVPAAAIRRFLADPGMWRGLAVPETPPDAAGVEGGPPDARTYDVHTFDRDGRHEPFAKARGYDTKTMRKIVALRKMETNDRQEADALLETYRAALGMD